MHEQKIDNMCIGVVGNFMKHLASKFIPVVVDIITITKLRNTVGCKFWGDPVYIKIFLMLKFVMAFRGRCRMAVSSIWFNNAWLHLWRR